MSTSSKNNKHNIINNCSKLSELIFDIKENINDQQYKNLLEYCKEIYDCTKELEHSNTDNDTDSENEELSDNEVSDNEEPIYYEEVNEIPSDEKTNITIDFNHTSETYPNYIKDCQCKKYKINDTEYIIKFNCTQNNLFKSCPFTYLLYKDFPHLQMMKELIQLNPIDSFLPITFTFIPGYSYERAELNQTQNINVYRKYKFILNMAEQYNKLILPTDFRNKDYRIVGYSKQLLFLISLDYLVNHIEIALNEPNLKEIVLNKLDTTLTRECVLVISEKLKFNILDVLEKFKNVLNDTN